MQATSLGAAFLQRCKLNGNNVALMQKKGDIYQSITYRELGNSVIALAAKLLELGVQPGERIGLISANRPEWAQVDFAALSIGAVIVPVYPSLSAAQAEYILQNAGVKHLFVEDAEQLAKAQTLLTAGEITRVYVFDEAADLQGGVLRLSQLTPPDATPNAQQQQAVEERLSLVTRDHLATFIYTSGTTGFPKGVMLTHGNFLANIEAVLQVLTVYPTDVMLSLLPLSHVFERLAGHFMPLLNGLAIAYAESPLTVAQNILEVKPTIMIAVPRLFEKIHNRIIDSVENSPFLRRRIFYWALGVGYQALERRGAKKVDLSFGLQRKIADHLVFSKIRARTGGRIRFFVSGGAALHVDTAEFFEAVGLQILEGYGMTETSPVLAFNRPEKNRIGTVGSPIPSVEIKIAADGEILARGPNVMQGYYNLPEETKAVLQEDGYLHTGDVGHFDREGHLVITDRKKNLIITSGGRNIAPSPIENLLKSSRYIGEVMVLGDGRHFLSALIVPDFEQLHAFAEQNDLVFTDDVELIRAPQIQALIESEIERLSKNLAPFEQVRKFTLLPREFSIQQNELTPSLKVKRKVVTEKFFELIENMYES